ncbi:hypothetical protein OAL24_01151 [Oenococcus sicerae]|nr:hypothetical protein OAL24_01151 [Oenococcus sicerae]
MKKRASIIVGSSLVAILLASCGAFWYLQMNSRQQRTVSTERRKSEKQKSNDKKIVLKASGYNYKIATVKGTLGGVFATPTSLTKILNKKIILDLVASLPGMNGSELISMSCTASQWQVKVKRFSINYTIQLTHYQDSIGLISLSSSNIHQQQDYTFTIPEKYYALYRKEDAKIASSFSKAANTALISSNSSERSSAESSSFEGLKNIQDIITGKGFDITPILYDGEDVDKAMNENKALQNTVHDNFIVGYFQNATTARVASMGVAYSEPYSLSDHYISIGSQDFKNIPYSLNGNTVTFSTWQTQTSDGHTITWKMAWDSDARDIVGAKTTQNP